MRQIERIPVFIDLIDGRLTDLFQGVWEIYDLIVNPDDKIDDYYDKIEDVVSYWKENPDLRFSQVLVNFGIIENVPGSWYYLEENEILEALGVSPESFLIWGNRYDKDMNLLPKVIYKPINQLQTDHIQAILDGNWAKDPTYIKAFKNELLNRGIDYDNS